MSIRPLDLQTLFVKMANVGKEQAMIQKSVENQQAREAGELIKEENRRDKAVNKAEEDKESDRVKRENENPKDQKSSHDVRGEDSGEEKRKPNYYTDPKRGHNLDISG